MNWSLSEALGVSTCIDGVMIIFLMLQIKKQPKSDAHYMSRESTEGLGGGRDMRDGKRTKTTP